MSEIPPTSPTVLTSPTSPTSPTTRVKKVIKHLDTPTKSRIRGVKEFVAFLEENELSPRRGSSTRNLVECFPSAGSKTAVCRALRSDRDRRHLDNDRRGRPKNDDENTKRNVPKDIGGVNAKRALKRRDNEIARLRGLLDEERKKSADLRRTALFVRHRGLMEGFGSLGSGLASSTQRWQDWVGRALQHAWINRDNAASGNPFRELFRDVDEQQATQIVEKAQRLYADLCCDIHQADLQTKVGDSDVTDAFRRQFLKAMEPKYRGEDGNVDLLQEMQRYA